MINFFRKIRKKLADDNKPLKYARYAIGEIVLVVIGILIALQINTWNEGRKNRNAEQSYLSRIRGDLINDSIYYARSIKVSERILSNHSMFIKEIYKQQHDTEDVRKLFQLTIYNNQYLNIQNSTYIELINSGKLDIFSKTYLKETIINYYRENEIISSQISEANASTKSGFDDMRKIIPASIKYYSIFDKNLWTDTKMYNNKDWVFLNDPSSMEFQTLENTVAFFYVKHQTFISYYIKLKAMNAKLIKDLDLEIGNKSLN
jgi:hypothetical protein